MNNPFLFDGPGVISFSGGRTSGMMLWMTIQAYGGTLPADVVVCFANTGKEEEATLEFRYATAASAGASLSPGSRTAHVTPRAARNLPSWTLQQQAATVNPSPICTMKKNSFQTRSRVFAQPN